MAHCRLGDHICLFYRSLEELLSTLVPYVRVGLQRNEQCLCIESADVTCKLLKVLEAEGLPVDLLIQRRALVLLRPEQAYLPGGRFDPEVMSKLLSASICQAAEEGFSGFRVTGDMRWACNKKPGCNRLLEYEILMERFFPTRPAIGLCTYSVKHFSPAKLRDVLAVHHFALLEGYPVKGQRTFRINSASLFGDVVFDESGNGRFQCLIHRKSGDLLSRTQANGLGAAITSVKRQLRQLRGNR